MPKSASKDSMMSLLASNYALTASQTVIAQWNMNNYSRPKTYGYFSSNASATSPASYYISSTSSYSKSFTSTVPQLVNTFSPTFNSSNIVRIMFDASIASVSGLESSVSDFAVVVYPYTSNVLQTAFISSTEISLTENIYQRQEIFYCSNVYSTLKFDRLDVYIYPTNEVSGGTVVVNVKNFNISQVTEKEMQWNQHDRLSWVFEPNRPGDQILENNLITASVNPVTKYYIVTDTLSDRIRTPELIPAYLNPYNESMYYMTAENTLTYKNIYVDYDNVAVCNQIYIKSQDIGARMAGTYFTSRTSQIRVYTKTGGTWNSTPIYTELSTGSFINNGAVVLQYNGSTWSAGYDYTTLPVMTPAGAIANTASIQGIKIEIANNDTSSSRIVEISPRLSVNLSNFLVNSEYSSSLDEGNYAIPVGLSGANNATITLENLPRYTGADKTGNLYQIFENNPYSILNGLIGPNVKFTLYTTLTDTKTSSNSSTIKNFTMYSDKWTSNDLSTSTINLSDYAKYLQSTDAPDFVVMSDYHAFKIGTLQQAIETLLQLSGFSDYDINSLSTVSQRLKKKIGARIPIFYASKERKVWDVLSEIILGYQVSAFFDENGILQFRDILRESASGTFFANSSSYFNLTNTTLADYLPNIVSCNIEKKETMGNITLNYKQMSESNNVYSVNGSTVDQSSVQFGSKITVVPTNSKTKPWEISNEPSGLICANIVKNFLKTDRVIQVGDYTTSKSTQTNAGKPRFITSFKGYGLVEGEAVSWDGIEYAFSPSVPNFSAYEIVKSSDELSDAVARRFAALTTRILIQSITFSTHLGNGRSRFVIGANSHGLKVRDTVQISIYNSSNRLLTTKSAMVESVTANSFNTILDSNIRTLISGGIGADTSVVKDVSKISYRPTGRLMNVKRGLFGTSVDDHFSTTYYSASAFKGFALNTATVGPQNMDLGITLNQQYEIENGTSYPLGTKKNYTTYFGSLGNDSPYYNEYRFIFTPQNDLDNFGIFLGASVTAIAGGGSARFTTTNYGNYGDGIFIEFFPDNDSGTTGAVVRKTSGRRSNDSDVIYYSLDKYLLDKYRPPQWVYIYKQDPPGTGSFVRDDQGKKILIKKIWQTYPPKQQEITVSVSAKEGVGGEINIKVNGKKMKFYPKGVLPSRSTSNIISVGPTFSRVGRSFGVFLRNDSMTYSKINLQQMQSRAGNQIMDQQISWSEAGNPEITDLNALVGNNLGQKIVNDPKRRNGFIHSARPFSLRAEPLLKGLAIFDLKWEGDKPYFDLDPIGPYGIDGTQNFNENDIQKSRVVGTPFRGRIVYRNTKDEIAPLKGSSDSFIPAMIAGKSIGDTGERKIKRSLSGRTGLDNVEISIPWVNNEGTVQRILSNIADNVNDMNTIFQVEMFGNPALSVGDYLKLTYSEKNISASIVVVSKLSTNFSSEGISTTATLRRANLSN